MENEVSILKSKIDYLEDTLACLRGENASLKAKLDQQTTNNQIVQSHHDDSALDDYYGTQPTCSNFNGW